MSGRIPRSFVDELLARVDIVELIGSRLPLRKGGREFKGLCPFHSENTPSFTVSPDKGFYHCFGCGAHGSALGFLMEYDRLSFPEAVELLAAQLGLAIPYEDGPATAEDQHRPLYTVLELAASLYAQCLRSSEAAIEYLKRRGLDGATAQRFGLGYAPAAWDTALSRLGGSAERIAALEGAGLVIANDRGRRYDRFRDRIMFPIRDPRGRVVGFGGRVLQGLSGDRGDAEPKYLNSPETAVFHKGSELYGLYEARQALRQIPQLLVVEGYMDVVGLSRHGLHYAVATLGTATTAAQLRRLFRVTEEVVFCFDGDRAGRAAAWRALENALPEAQQGRRIGFLFLPEGEDPDSLIAREGPQAFESRLNGATNLSEFLVQRLAEEIDTSSVDGRARLAERARPLLARIPAGVYKELLLEALADTVSLPAPRLRQLIDADAPATQAHRPAQRQARPPRGTVGRSSLVRAALRLVLHYPQIALQGASPDFLTELERPGTALLHGVIADIRAHPGTTTGMLIEHWREHDEGRHLGRLLDQELLIDETGAAQEYAGLMARLLDAYRNDRIDRLREKERLTDAEKEELRGLLRGPSP